MNTVERVKARREEILRIATSHSFTRFPLCEGDPDHVIGLIHIRDLLAFMTARARTPESGKGKAPRKKPFPAGLDLRAVELAMPLWQANIIRKLLFVPPSIEPIEATLLV